jgi:hypothetical protein
MLSLCRAAVPVTDAVAGSSTCGKENSCARQHAHSSVLDLRLHVKTTATHPDHTDEQHIHW